MRDRLNVYYCGCRAGVLEYDDDVHRFFFTYADEYLSAEDVSPLSMSLPLRTGSAGALESRFFFENLLPPEIVRRKLEKIIHVSWDNVFGMLKALGGDCAGAISLYAEGDGPNPDAERVQELSDDEADEILRLLPQRPLLVEQIEGYRISGSGAQDKLIARIADGHVALPLFGAPSTHIIKPPAPRFHDSVENECFCQRLAQEVGLSAAECGIIRIKTSPYFWTKRFDRTVSGETVLRLHQEDFCQAMRYSSEKKYEFEGGPSLVKCLSFLRESDLGASGMLQFLDDVIYNLLIGNADAHAKNYAILYRDGSPAIAPLYDAMCTTVYPGVPANLAMKVGGVDEVANIRREHFVALAEKASIRPQLILSRLDSLAEKLLRKATELKTRMSDEGTPSPIYDEILTVIGRHIAQTRA